MSKLFSNKEKQNDLYKANQYSLRCIWISQIIITVTWILDLLNVFIIDKRLVNIAFIGVSLLFVLAHLIKKFVGFDNEKGSYLILFILVAIISFANVFLSYHTTMFMLFPMVCAVLYFEKKYTIYTFVLTAIGMLLAVVLSFKIGLCDANMLIMTTSTSLHEAELIKTGDVTINNGILSIIGYYYFPRFIILTGFSFLVEYIKTHISERTAKETEIKRIAETDGLTRLYNRNKYNQVIREGKSESVAVIYIDINDLKKINDALGHEQGDVLILGMARILRKLQTDRVNAFRLGGDEFVVIIDNPTALETIETVDHLRQEIAEAKLEHGLVLSAAMGYAEGERIRIEDVIKEADANMYANKKAMKNALNKN